MTSHHFSMSACIMYNNTPLETGIACHVVRDLFCKFYILHHMMSSFYHCETINTDWFGLTEGDTVLKFTSQVCNGITKALKQTEMKTLIMAFIHSAQVFNSKYHVTYSRSVVVFLWPLHGVVVENGGNIMYMLFKISVTAKPSGSKYRRNELCLLFCFLWTRR